MVQVNNVSNATNNKRTDKMKNRKDNLVVFNGQEEHAGYTSAKTSRGVKKVAKSLWPYFETHNVCYRLVDIDGDVIEEGFLS